jgi:hypothetical protein
MSMTDRFWMPWSCGLILGSLNHSISWIPEPIRWTLIGLALLTSVFSICTAYADLEDYKEREEEKE